MARFYTDFSTDTLGQLPAGTELKRSAVVGDYQIVNDGGVKTLRFARSAGAQSARGLRYSNVSSSGRVELYASIRDENTNPASARLVAYASDSPDNEYGCYLNGQASLNVYKRVAGGFSFLGTVNIPQGNEYWDVRFQVEPGTPNVIRAKTWLSTLSEPASWDIETTDESFDLEAGTQVGGWIGHVGFDDNPFVFFREIGIGTDGDPAPTQAITNETVTSDTELAFNIQQALTAELELNYDLRESLQADLQSTWNMLNGIHMDVAATWSIIQNLTADLQADWQIVQNVDKDVYLPWSIESAIQTAIKDLTTSWQIRHAVVASLNTQWQLLAALEIDMQSRWNIAQSIVTDLQLLFDQRETVQHDATLTWHQIAITESSITFVWKLGDTVLPPISIIKIRPETRVFRAVIH